MDSSYNISAQDIPDADIIWPRKAVVTAGMPYGNKPLHFGHIGGVFVPADAYARFLRDRIGADNVRFVCGTDCFGSPIDEGFRKASNDGYDGTIEDYVLSNHNIQSSALDDFDISLDIFEGSGIGHSSEVHQALTNALIEGLFENGCLKRFASEQFYDEKAGMFLNGRQVQGKCCPVQGCKAEHAYADECDLGHQYSPADLMGPISSVTSTVPVLKPVENWYFDLPAYRDFLSSYVQELESDDKIREVVTQDIAEFLAPPVIYVKNDAFDVYESIKSELPAHEYKPAENGKASFGIEFASIEDRDKARSILESNKIRFRTSKTLVPFRITGNASWGLKAPKLGESTNLTVWCWPESLWAPISFTIAANDALGLPRDSWRDFWCAENSRVYQFIGEDNIYFYGVAQSAIFEALGKRGVFGGVDSKPLKQTILVANHHLLFGKSKASSSGAICPPSAAELLEHYTVDELRAHFLALGLDQRSVKFSPKPFDPALTEQQREDPRRADPVLKEGALLSNVFNRLARSCLYAASRDFDTSMPLGDVSSEVYLRAKQAMSAYEHAMDKIDIRGAFSSAEELIRYSNKFLSSGMSETANQTSSTQNNASSQDGSSEGSFGNILRDAFYLLRICTLLMHPFVPSGCEKICNYLDFDPSEFFSWNYDFKGNDELCNASEINVQKHMVCELPPKFDFFPKHPSRFNK